MQQNVQCRLTSVQLSSQHETPILAQGNTGGSCKSPLKRQAAVCVRPLHSRITKRNALHRVEVLELRASMWAEAGREYVVFLFSFDVTAPPLAFRPHNLHCHRLLSYGPKERPKQNGLSIRIAEFSSFFYLSFSSLLCVELALDRFYGDLISFSLFL